MTSTSDGRGAPTVPGPLTRFACELPAAPVRIVHLGLGNFHRAHQAWYTAESTDAGEWGIAAFTGRTPDAAVRLARQDGLYTLIERAEGGDEATIIGSISMALDGADTGRMAELIAAETTAVVTLTVTEPGYRLGQDGSPDLTDPAVVADHDMLRSTVRDGRSRSAASPTTALGRLLLGLDTRRRASGAPVAVVPCDNIPSNGPLVADALGAFAEEIDPSLASWIGESVSFVSTSVDRITPRATEADVAAAARLTGRADGTPVVTEPFSDWVLSGDFPAGRPRWEGAGARFVQDIEPFERRKLWLLNGAHSLLAYAGPPRGHTTVARAIADDALCRAVEELWNEAERHLPAGALDLDSYRASLLARFGNSRIEHRLSQIAMEGTTKLRVRIAPIARAERDAGRDAQACAMVLGAWAGSVLRGDRVVDAHVSELRTALDGDAAGALRRLVAVIDDDLSADAGFMACVRDSAPSSIRSKEQQ